MLGMGGKRTDLHVNLQDIERGDGKMGSTGTEHSSHCTESIIA